MFELLISDKVDDVISLNVVAKRLKTEALLVKGVCVFDTYQNRERICIAVPEKASDYILARVKDELVEYVAVEYKYRHFKQKLDLSVLDPFLNAAFLSALAVFDKVTDKRYIADNLFVSNEINLDSAFAFKFPLLADRWDEIVSLVEQNIVQLSGRTGLLEMMKFLLTSSPCESDEVIVCQENGCNVIKNANGEPQFVVDKTHPEQLVHLLVTLVPQKLIIEDANLERLKEIFDSRVQIFK